MQHFFDGGVQEFGNVVGEFVVHAGRERFLLDLLEFLLDFLNDGGGVGAGTLLENDGARGVTVDVRVNVEELRALSAVGAMTTACSSGTLVPMADITRILKGIEAGDPQAAAQ